MQKRTFFLIILVVSLIAISAMLAYNPTRPTIINGFIAMGTMMLSGLNSIIASTWFQTYGIGIVGILSLIAGITVTALYYRGKLKIWRYGAAKSSELVSGRQPAPAPSPTPLSTPTPIAQTPKPAEEKSEAET